MSVEFEEEKGFYTSRKLFGDRTTPGMVRGLMRMGIVRSQQAGYYMLIALTIIFIVLAFAVQYLHGYGWI